MPETVVARQLSTAIIGPDDSLRRSLIDALSQCGLAQVSDFSSYPPKTQDINNLLAQQHDVVMIELDSNPEYAVNIMRAICASGRSTVMVYSRMSEADIQDSDILARCTRIGAREFLSLPFETAELSDALARADLRHLGRPQADKDKGRLLIFCGAKGGAGVTNIACNFAVNLAQLSAEKTLLIDMDLPLGDAALHLGLRSQYSTNDALQNYTRIDSSFLLRLVIRHSSGLDVLPAPGRFPSYPAPKEALDRLLRVARQEFENVVVDAGSKLDLTDNCTEYLDSSTVYLVTQSGIPELRNANRLIERFRSMAGPALEVVLNRYPSNGSRLSEEEILRALTCPVSWKIPNDYSAVRAMQDTSAAVVASGSSISAPIDAMVRAACGLPPAPPQRKGFGFRRWFGSARKHEDRPARSTGALQLDLIAHAEMASSPHPDGLTCPVPAQAAGQVPLAGIYPRRESSWNC